MDTNQAYSWTYLTPNPNSYLRQLFVERTDFLARDPYGLYSSPEDPMRPEVIAAAYGVPVEAVQEAIAYCQSDPPEIRRDIEAQDAFLAAKGLGKTP